MGCFFRVLSGLLAAALLAACAVSPEPEPELPWQVSACQAIGAAPAGPWPGGLPTPAALLPTRALPESPALVRSAGRGAGFACLNPLMRQPLAAPELLQRIGNGLPAPAASATDWLRWLACAGDLGRPCQQACLAPPADAAQAAQVDAVLAGLPAPGLRPLLRPLLLALARAHAVVQDLHPPGYGADAVLDALQQAGVLPWPADKPPPAAPQAALDWLDTRLDTADGVAMACTGLALGAAVQQAVADLRALQAGPGLPTLRWQAASPWGRLQLDTGNSDDTHEISDQALLIDLGGNDTYRFGAASRARALGVLIDLAGDDVYASQAPGAGPAVALGGLQLLWDGGGNDLYEGAVHPMSQAAAVLGLAVLVDESGDDVYRAALASQAWALGGLALLLDGAGDDRYHALSMAQGSAQPMGAALLADLGGRDRYTLAATPLLRPSAQLPERNLSMGQGAATGWWRPDAPTRSRPGGLGVLFDAAGDDVYLAQVFAQGAGYLRGTGLLIDGGGADRFDAAWYGMGAGAHLGVGLLLKRGGGDDRYHLSHASGLGLAHDASLGVLLDEGGNDHYDAAELAFGASHDEGVGLWIDLGGHDRFRLRGTRCRAFGAAVQPDPAPGGQGDAARGRSPPAAAAQGVFVHGLGSSHYHVGPDPDCARLGHQRRWQGFSPGGQRQGLGLDLAVPAPDFPH